MTFEKRIAEAETSLIEAERAVVARTAEFEAEERRLDQAIAGGNPETEAKAHQRVSAAAAALAVEERRCVVFSKVIDDLEADRRASQEASEWQKVRKMGQERRAAADRAEEALRAAGEAFRTVVELTTAMQVAVPREQCGILARSEPELHLANSMIRAGLGRLFPNARDIQPTHLGLADHVAGSNRRALTGWGNDSIEKEEAAA
ncbi:MAG: hypothetical protein Q8P46_16330 [Hyphomicrobiales bacterium]|nr:hypothetical protein [Hyphomicrobiales bacterium]